MKPSKGFPASVIAVSPHRHQRFTAARDAARHGRGPPLTRRHRLRQRRAAARHRHRAWGIDGTHLGVLYVGRLAAEKNLALAERAFRRIQEKYPPSRFVLVGDGPLRRPLERRNPDFIFCGMQRGIPLAEHYASSDLLLFPSMTETFGNVVLEAMASGLPVMAFDYAAPRMHIQSGHNGITAPFGDEARYLSDAGQLARPPVQLQATGASARQTAMALSWDCIVQRFANLIRDQLDVDGAEHEYA